MHHPSVAAGRGALQSASAGASAAVGAPSTARPMAAFVQAELDAGPGPSSLAAARALPASPALARLQHLQHHHQHHQHQHQQQQHKAEKLLVAGGERAQLRTRALLLACARTLGAQARRSSSA